MDAPTYTRPQLVALLEGAKNLGFDDDAQHWQSLLDEMDGTS